MKVRYDGPEPMFNYEGNVTGRRYVFVGNIPTEVDEKDIPVFAQAGGFTVLRDDILGTIKTDEVKESPQKVEARKKRITKDVEE